MCPKKDSCQDRRHNYLGHQRQYIGLIGAIGDSCPLLKGESILAINVHIWDFNTYFHTKTLLHLSITVGLFAFENLAKILKTTRQSYQSTIHQIHTAKDRVIPRNQSEWETERDPI